MEADAGNLGNDSRIENCFFKINDDILKPGCSGMLFKDNIVWQQMVGGVVDLGWNSRLPINNVTISGLDIIACDRGVDKPANRPYQSVICLNNSYGAVISNMVVENIRLEKRPYRLFGVHIKPDNQAPGTVKGQGSINDLVFRNISVSEMPACVSYFNGNGDVTPTSSGDIKNIIFDNVNIAGELVTETNASKYFVRQGKTSDFHYLSTASAP